MGRHQEGLVHALSCQLAPTGRAVRIPRRQTCGRIVGGWGCRETPPVGVAMLRRSRTFLHSFEISQGRSMPGIN